MRLIVLVRDGVINVDATGSAPFSNEWQAIPGALEAIARLNQHDFRVAIVCLQPVTGWHSDTGLDALNAINEKMYLQLARLGGQVDGLFFNTSAEAADTSVPSLQCDMLNEVSTRFGVAVDNMFVIVNREQDLIAVRKSGARAVLVGQVEGKLDCENFPHLAQAINFVIEET